MTGISHLKIHNTPIAVIDFETTGLSAGTDRVVEVSVVRVDPGHHPRVVFESLVNPSRKMGGTKIHGITEADVANSPKFQEIAQQVVAACSGCVLSAYNAYFDMKFLKFELSNAGIDHDVPFFCLMYLRPMLDIGEKCKLGDACGVHGIEYGTTHRAASDALAAASLFCEFRKLIGPDETFGDLAKRRSYKFCESFDCIPFPIVETAIVEPEQPPMRARSAMGEYWEALCMAVSDLNISDDEVQIMQLLSASLDVEELRVLHAKAFASVLSQFASDGRITDSESRKLTRLSRCLGKLGWAPGE